jgi:cell wall-associated NlpC family hydrolase
MRGLKVICLCLLSLLLLIPVSSFAASAHLLKQGVTGDEVYQLQVKLQEYGYYNDNPDGVFGAETKSAVISFQLDVGLDPDGVVGPTTMNYLRDFKHGNIAVNRGMNSSRLAQQIIVFAKQFRGVPYVWAGRSPYGFDCSGFVTYVYDHFGITLPRMADEQYDFGLSVSSLDLQLGDLVFFSTYEPGPSHVGIYIGGGQFIHASSGAGEVTITPMSKTYYVERYLGAKRVIR